MKLGNKVYVDKVLQPPRYFNRHILYGLPYYFPIVGVLYVHEDGFAVAGKNIDIIDAIKYFEEVVPPFHFAPGIPAIVSQSEIKTFIILQNGCLVDPVIATMIQNNIKLLMHDKNQISWESLSVHDINYILQRKYATRYKDEIESSL